MGRILEYRIEEKQPFSVVGVKKHFQFENCYEKLPLYWKQVMDSKDHPVGVFGVVHNSLDGEFDYLIGDLYYPWKEISDQWNVLTFNKQKWLIFPITGKLPEALQEVNTIISDDWLEEHPEITVNGNYNIELYGPPTEDPNESYSEIWLPIK